MPSLPMWMIVSTKDDGSNDSNGFLLSSQNISSSYQSFWHGLQSNPSNFLTVRDGNGGLSSYNSVNNSLVLNPGQQRALQSVAFASSAISLLAALLAIYWFCMMRRSFRRDLILLLIAGGSWKSLWFVIFGAVEFSHGSVSSSGAFCQASGYMLEVGFEACDFAVLSMSLHMLLQIFPPAQSILANDGLYRIRGWIFALWIILPNLAASLAFINPVDAYTSVGGFCFLPVRPFWYRLALFWIPRYLIWLFIMYVVIRIYRHVGREFEVFGQERDDSASTETRRRSTLQEPDAKGEEAEGAAMEQQRRPTNMTESTIMEEEKSPSDQDPATDDTTTSTAPRTDEPAPPPAAISRVMQQPPSAWRHSLPLWAGRTRMSLDTSTPSASLPASRRGSRQVTAEGIFSEDFAPATPSRDVSVVGPVDWTPVLPSVSASPTSPSSPLRAATAAASAPAENSFATPQNTSQISASSSAIHRRVAANAMQARRRAIQRQLRLLFIYPIVYMLLWIMPSIVHFMNYSNHFAQHPVFALSVIQTFCLTIMTTVDVVIFCWRERPWRHVPGSDGTVGGSLCWWRVVRKVEWTEGRRESRAPALLPPAANEGTRGVINGVNSKSERSGSRQGLLSSFISRPFGDARWMKSRGSGSTDGRGGPRPLSPRRDSTMTPTSVALPLNNGPATARQRPMRSNQMRTPYRPAWHSASLLQQQRQNQQQQQQRKRFSGGSDRRQMETDRAYERLALERQEYEARKREMAERRVRDVEAGRGGAKEWFDREMLESFEDGDEDEDDDVDEEEDDGDAGDGSGERRHDTQEKEVQNQTQDGGRSDRNHAGVG